MIYLIKDNYKLFSCVFAFILFISCINSRYDIYEKYPIGTSLDTSLIRDSNMIFKTNQGLVLMYNFVEEYSDEFNPHLLFFVDNKLIASSYFFSENIYDYENGKITAYQNENRLKRGGIYRKDVPQGLELEYKKYDLKYPHGPTLQKGVITEIKYNRSDSKVDFVLKDGSVYNNIPLWKMIYNYYEGEINVNETYSSKTRESKIFKVSKKTLDAFFKKFN